MMMTNSRRLASRRTHTHTHTRGLCLAPVCVCGAYDASLQLLYWWWETENDVCMFALFSTTRTIGMMYFYLQRSMGHVRWWFVKGALGCTGRGQTRRSWWQEIHNVQFCCTAQLQWSAPGRPEKWHDLAGEISLAGHIPEWQYYSWCGKLHQLLCILQMIHSCI